jgi:hypothetical protein
LAQRLNKLFKTDKFQVVKLTTGQSVQENDDNNFMMLFESCKDSKYNEQITLRNILKLQKRTRPQLNKVWGLSFEQHGY